jgi:hypothetical protein
LRGEPLAGGGAVNGTATITSGSSTMVLLLNRSFVDGRIARTRIGSAARRPRCEP